MSALGLVAPPVAHHKVVTHFILNVFLWRNNHLCPAGRNHRRSYSRWECTGRRKTDAEYSL